MNSETDNRDAGIALLWIWFALILIYHLFGSVVTVRHSDLSISFSEAVQSIEIKKLLESPDESAWVGVALAVCVFY